MLSCPKDNTLVEIRASLVAGMVDLAAQGASLSELADGLTWAIAFALPELPEHAAMLDELLVDLRAGRIVEVRVMGRPRVRTEVLTILTTGPLRARVHELVEAATDTDGNTWPAGTRVAPLSTGQRDDLRGCPFYQCVTIAGVVRTFLSEPRT